MKNTRFSARRRSTLTCLMHQRKVSTDLDPTSFTGFDHEKSSVFDDFLQLFIADAPG